MTQAKDAPPHVWHRIAEEVQQAFPGQDLKLSAYDVESYFVRKNGGKIPRTYMSHIVDTIKRTARTYGIEVKP